MKPRPPTLREKKRYLLLRIDPPIPDPDPKDLYFSVLESVTSIYGDAEAARMMPVVISCGSGYAIVRCIRGYEEKLRIAIVTLTSVTERRIALHAVATSGTLLALRRRVSGLSPVRVETISSLHFRDREYTARRYQGQKVDLQEKGINRQELLFLTQDDLEGI